MALVAVKTMRFSVKIISLSGISDIKIGQKAVISTQILLQKAVNHIQILPERRYRILLILLSKILQEFFSFRNLAIF